MGFQFYGWWNWHHHKDVKAELVIEGTSLRDLGIWTAVSSYFVGELKAGAIHDDANILPVLR